MRVFVVVNRVREIGFRQTTTLLIHAFRQRGDDVFLADVDGFQFADCHRSDPQASPIQVEAIPVPAIQTAETPLGASVDALHAIESFAKAADLEGSQRISLTQGDLILIRTNPGRDTGRKQMHQTFLELCQIASGGGIEVVNAPQHLSFFASKAAIALLAPSHRPVMRISDQLTEIAQFIEDAGVQCVVKPLVGSRGENVIRLAAEAVEVVGTDEQAESVPPLVARLASTFTENVPLVVQHFVRSTEPGDKRVVVLDGQILEREGSIAGIHRVPAEGDFRANLHAGGTALPLTLSSPQRVAAEAAAKLLADHGVRLAGVDLVGDKVIEFNVFSTGGIFDAIRFSKVDFARIIVDQLASQLR